MDVKEAIQTRRAYRSLVPTQITNELIDDLSRCAQLAPSCFNNQPWRYVFVYDKEKLRQLHSALTPTNRWVQAASLIIVVFSRRNLDCVIKGRVYYLFDTGIATGFIILRATELGLVAHPIAGFNELKVKAILGIPEDMKVITLVNVGKHSEAINELLTDKQVKTEPTRPQRIPLSEFVHLNSYNKKLTT